MNKQLQLITCIITFVASLHPCHAGVVTQMDATRVVSTTESNITWQAAPGIYLVGDAADWVATNNTIQNVTGPTASALTFSNAMHEATARYLVFALKIGKTVRFRQTLAESFRIFRLYGEPVTLPAGETGVFEDYGWCTVGGWKVNGEAGGVVRANKKLIIEVDMGEDLKLRDLALFSSFGRREWERAWGGSEEDGFYEFIFFDSVPSEDVLVATRRYLDVQHALQLGMPRPSSTQVNAAIAEGVKTKNLFSVLFMIK